LFAAWSEQSLFVPLLAAPAEEEKEEEGRLSAAACSAVMVSKCIYSSALLQQLGVGCSMAAIAAGAA
jgi:hypothetical protein